MSEYFGRKFPETLAWNQIHKLVRNEATEQAERLLAVLKGALDSDGNPAAAFDAFLESSYNEPYIYPGAVMQMMLRFASDAAYHRVTAELTKVKDDKSEKARKSANVRHDKPRGSREKRRKIQEIWATGKYSTRDRCAEEECAALGMSFATARKALIKIPKPKLAAAT